MEELINGVDNWFVEWFISSGGLQITVLLVMVHIHEEVNGVEYTM